MMPKPLLPRLTAHTARRTLTCLLLGFVGWTAQAQTVPDRIVSMVVPYPAGGPSDFIARQLHVELGKQLGQQVIVDNIGGAGGALGIQKVLTGTPDGHLMVMASPMELVLAPLAMSAVKHKPEDLRLAGVLVDTSMVMLARKDLPGNTVDELVALAKVPGAKQLTYGSVGPGSLYHLVAEVFSQQTGIKMLHVPYKGAAPLLTDLMGGQIDIVFMPLSGGVPGLIKDGKIKAYGTATKGAHPLFTSMPALSDSKALDNFEFNLWAGVLVPKATPDAAVDKLNKAIYEALKNPDIRKAYEATGNQVGKPMGLPELSRLYTVEIARYQAIAKAVNVQPQ